MVREFEGCNWESNLGILASGSGSEGCGFAILRPMRKPWTPSPTVAPPVTPAFGWPTSAVQYVLCASFLVLWTWLIWARFFARRTSSHLLDAKTAWVYIPFVVMLMPLMHSAVNGMCEDSGDLAAFVPVVDDKIANRVVMVFRVRCTMDSITVDGMHTPLRHAHAHTTHTSRRLRRWWSSR